MKEIKTKFDPERFCLDEVLQALREKQKALKKEKKKKKKPKIQLE